MKAAVLQEAVAVESGQDPRNGEDLFVSQDKAGIHSIEKRNETRDDLVRYVLRRVNMKDGHSYDVQSFSPHLVATNIPVTMTVPWMTEMSGFNTHMARNLAKLGFEVDLVSAERDIVLNPDIRASAANQLLIAEATARLHDRDTEKRIAIGVSRGAMIGFSLAAQAEEYGSEVIYGDYIAPCYPENLRAKQLLQHARLPISELSTLRHVLELPLATLKHYPASLSVRPKSIINHLASAPHLMSGVAGQEAAKMPRDSVGHVTAFRGDIMSQGENWQEIFADSPNMAVELIAGGAHLSCASPTAMQSWKARFKTLAKELS